MIPIDLVSSATDSIKRSIVLFKPVPVPTSDPKSEFLCQSSHCCAEPTDPLESTLYAWDISHALVHHISPVLPQSQCSNRVPEAEAPSSTSQTSWSQLACSSRAECSTQTQHFQCLVHLP